jgi:16S rRNA (guanine1207-N2)-methyltransferase
MSHYYKNDPQLKHTTINIRLDYHNQAFNFQSDDGVFSKDEVDTGSMALLNYLSSLPLSGNLLDVGCGYGLLGVVLGKLFPQLQVTMVDVNERALVLSQLNLANHHLVGAVYYSDAYTSVTGCYDYIISNPPIRAGKSVVHRILVDAKGYLAANGKLIIVMRKSHGAPSAIALLKSHYQTVTIVDRFKGFYIIEAKK